MSRLAPPRVYAIADAGALAPRLLPEAVEEMAQAGVRWIQVRAKGIGDAALCRQLDACCRRLEGSAVALWIDDRADLASVWPLFGVHLGQDDLPPAVARELLPAPCRIGWSTHGPTQVIAGAVDEVVDLLAIGPVFPTSGKERPDAVVGLEGVGEARRLTDKPLVAIGGIDADSAPAVWAAGADAVAVIGAVCRGAIADNCRRLLRAAEEAA